MRKRSIVALLACVPLAVPAGAAAHARSPAVALDYRLRLDPATTHLPGVSVAILDGDRDLRIGTRGVTVTVKGDLGEPMLRIGPSGTWVNRASVTAAAEKLTKPASGWKRLGSGTTFAWHEHRLAPPPYDGSRLGGVARFTIPAMLDGRPIAIGGTFVRFRRPQLWPWLAAAVLLLAVALGAARTRPRLRPALATGLGAVAGLAALTGLATFDAADAPNGRVAWVQIVLAAALGVVVYGALARLQGVRRAHLGGVLGVAAGAVTLGSLAVFRHGVVISLLPAAVTRGLCLVALAGGVAAAVTSYTVEDVR